MHRVFADEQKPFHVEYVEADVNDEDDNNESKEFYKVLGVKPDASQQEISAAYRRLSQKMHPDKTSELSPKLKRFYQQQQIKLNEANEVLSNEEKRIRYDILGKEGLLVPLDHWKNFDELRQICKEEKIKKRKLTRELRTAATTKASISLHAQNLFDRMEDVPYIFVTELSSQQSFQTPITDDDVISFSSFQNLEYYVQEDEDEEPVQRVNHSMNVLYRKTIEHTSHIEAVLQYQPDAILAQVGGERQFSPICAASMAWNVLLSPAFMLGGFDVTVKRAMGDNLVGQLKWSHSRLFKKSITAALEKRISDDTTLTTQLKVSDTTSAKIELSTPITDDETITCTGSVSHDFVNGFGFELEAFGSRKLLENSEIGLGVGVGTSGVALKLLFRRDRHSISIPIVLNDNFDMKTLLISTMIPACIYGIIRGVIIKPWQERKRKRELKKKREEKYAETKEAREEAMKELERMEPEIKQRINEEEEVRGLIIINATYGKLDEVDIQVEHPPYIDVTKQLQYYVKNSELILDEFTKSKLEGFYDPCPGEPKQLEVFYRFKGSTHKVIIDDEQELRIPLPEDLMPDVIDEEE